MCERTKKLFRLPYFLSHSFESTAHSQRIAMRERVISDPVPLGVGAVSETSSRRILQALAHDEEGGLNCTLLQKIEKLVRGSWPGTIIERVRQTLHESSLHRF